MKNLGVLKAILKITNECKAALQSILYKCKTALHSILHMKNINKFLKKKESSMKNYLVTFYYDNDKTYQALVTESIIEKYMDELKSGRIFWSEEKSYAAWIDMSKVCRVIAVEHIPAPPVEENKETKDCECEEKTKES